MAFDWPAAGSPDPAAGMTKKEGRMALKRYDVKVGKYETTLKLSDEDAKRLGLLEQPERAPAKARTAQNKARSAANKK